MQCRAIPEGFLQATEYPERPALGASNRDIDMYAKRLEFALWQCNQDKSDLDKWQEEKHHGPDDG